MKTPNEYYILLGIDSPSDTTYHTVVIMTLLGFIAMCFLKVRYDKKEYENNDINFTKYMRIRLLAFLTIIFVPVAFFIAPKVNNLGIKKMEYGKVVKDYKSIANLEYVSQKLYNVKTSNKINESDLEESIVNYFNLNDYQDLEYTQKIKNEFTEIFSDNVVYRYEYEYLVLLFDNHNQTVLDKNYNLKMEQMKELSLIKK